MTGLGILEDFEADFGLRLNGGGMEYSRDLTNLDLGERGDEEGESVGELGSSLFVCVTRTYMILFILKGIYDNVNSIYCHMVIKTKRR